MEEKRDTRRTAAMRPPLPVSVRSFCLRCAALRWPLDDWQQQPNGGRRQQQARTSGHTSHLTPLQRAPLFLPSPRCVCRPCVLSFLGWLSATGAARRANGTRKPRESRLHAQGSKARTHTHTGRSRVSLPPLPVGWSGGFSLSGRCGADGAGARLMGDERHRRAEGTEEKAQGVSDRTIEHTSCVPALHLHAHYGLARSNPPNNPQQQHRAEQEQRARAENTPTTDTHDRTTTNRTETEVGNEQYSLPFSAVRLPASRVVLRESEASGAGWPPLGPIRTRPRMSLT
jgi:hypothetical protein